MDKQRNKQIDSANKRAAAVWPLYVIYAALFLALSTAIIAGVHAGYNWLEEKGYIYPASYGEQSISDELAKLAQADEFEVSLLPTCYRYVQFSGEDFIMRETNMSAGDLDNARKALSAGRDSGSNFGSYTAENFVYGAQKIKDGSWVVVRADDAAHWVSRQVDDACIGPAELEATLVGLLLVLLLVIMMCSLVKRCRKKRLGSFASTETSGYAPEDLDYEQLDCKVLQDVEPLHEDSLNSSVSAQRTVPAIVLSNATEATAHVQDAKRESFDPKCFADYALHAMRNSGQVDAVSFIVSNEFDQALQECEQGMRNLPSWTENDAIACLDFLVGTIASDDATCSNSSLSLNFVSMTDAECHNGCGDGLNSWWVFALDGGGALDAAELASLESGDSSASAQLSSVPVEFLNSYEDLRNQVEDLGGITVVTNGGKTGAKHRRVIVALPA